MLDGHLIFHHDFLAWIAIEYYLHGMTSKQHDFKDFTDFLFTIIVSNKAYYSHQYTSDVLLLRFGHFRKIGKRPTYSKCSSQRALWHLVSQVSFFSNIFPKKNFHIHNFPFWWQSVNWARGVYGDLYRTRDTLKLNSRWKILPQIYCIWH